MQVEIERMKGENDELKMAAEQVQQEKWELTAANNDLQQRLQQTVALSYMQVGILVILVRNSQD